MTAPQEVHFIHIGNEATYCICKICHKSLFYLPQIVGYFIILSFSVQIIFTFNLNLVLHVNANRLLERKLRLFSITHYRLCSSSLWNGECEYNTGMYDNLLAFCYVVSFLTRRENRETFKRSAGERGMWGSARSRKINIFLPQRNGSSGSRRPHCR